MAGWTTTIGMAWPIFKRYVSLRECTFSSCKSSHFQRFPVGDLTKVCMTGDFLSHSLDDFASQMNVNFLGHVSTVRAFLPQLLARVKRGSGVTPTAFWTIKFGL